MPQLDPAPWLLYFTATWIVFSVMLPPKISAHTYPGEPTHSAAEAPELPYWHWPWS